MRYPITQIACSVQLMMLEESDETAAIDEHAEKSDRNQRGATTNARGEPTAPIKKLVWYPQRTSSARPIQ